MTERIAERSTTVAKAAFTMVSAMFDHGVGKHLATENPCRLLRISSIIGRGQAPRQRIGMNDEQLRAFLAALPALGKENELAGFKNYTGTRAIGADRDCDRST